MRKLNVYIDEKEKDFASADKSRLSDIHKYDGTKNKRKGFPMTPIEFAQFEMADALEIEKGQSLYRFGNYKNVKNEEIIDYYKKYDKALRSKMFLSSVSPDMLLSNQKSAYAIQAINFDILEHERIMEFMYCLAASFAQQENQTFEQTHHVYFPFVQTMVGTVNVPYGRQTLTLSRTPVLFLERYVEKIPKWDEQERSAEMSRFLELRKAFCLGFNFLRKNLYNSLDLNEEQLIDELCEAIKEYPIFDAYGISKRPADFNRGWPGKTLTYYRKLAAEMYMPRKEKGPSKE